MTKGEIVFGRNSVSQGKGKVIHLERFLDGVSLSPLRQVEAYWTALREEGAIPKRSQIDPRGLSAALEYTFILERIAPGMARFRIAGQHLCTLAGMEVRGMPVTAFFAPSARGEIGASLERVFDKPSVAEIDLRSERQRGVDQMAARMLMLPLRSDFGRTDRVLGALMTSERYYTGSTPVRFEISGLKFRNVDGEPAGPGFAAPAPERETGRQGFAEAETQAPLKGAPYLRLVKSEDG